MIVLKKDKNIKKEPIFESISIKYFLLFQFCMSRQFIKKPFKEFFFIFISEISWRVGIIFEKT